MKDMERGMWSDQMWDMASQMTHRYQRKLDQAFQELARVRQELGKIHQENARAFQEREQALEQLDRLHGYYTDLCEKLAEQTAENRQLRVDLNEMRDRAQDAEREVGRLMSRMSLIPGRGYTDSPVQDWEWNRVWRKPDE